MANWHAAALRAHNEFIGLRLITKQKNSVYCFLSKSKIENHPLFLILFGQKSYVYQKNGGNF